MNRLFIALLLAAVLLAACGPSNFECDMALEQFNNGALGFAVMGALYYAAALIIVGWFQDKWPWEV